MSTEQIKEFCGRFQPSYDTYMKKLLEAGLPEHVSLERTLRFKITHNRKPYVGELEN